VSGGTDPQTLGGWNAPRPASRSRRMSRHARSTFRWLTAALFVLTVAAIAFATARDEQRNGIRR